MKVLEIFIHSFGYGLCCYVVYSQESIINRQYSIIAEQKSLISRQQQYFNNYILELQTISKSIRSHNGSDGKE